MMISSPLPVTAQAKGEGKLNLRTRTGHFPSIKSAKPIPALADHRPVVCIRMIGS
jgi:hypothetical protein